MPGLPMVSVIRGRYEIRDKLGEGGMGVVYRAYDPPPMDRDVALKTLPSLPDAMALELFYQECRILKSISHPNVVEIFDMGVSVDDGGQHPFFVMPLLQGQTLDAVIRDASHGLTVARIVEIMAQACRGLQAAHDHGLVHRDVKPSNLFVLRDDSVKLIDFGVAHAVGLRSKSRGVDKGTLLYMAPEQVQQKPISNQSDIFSLGVVCYEALTRRHPFRRGTESDVAQAIVEWIPPPASEINPAVNQALSRVVHKAMAKQPWNRFDTARELGDTLQKALRNEVIELFDLSRIQPRLQRAAAALDAGDVQFAGEIVGELEAEGVIDAGLTLLRTRVDQITRQRTIAQLLDSARARFEQDEDPLALQKIEEILRLDGSHAAALGLKEKIAARRSERQVEQWVKLARQHLDNRAFGPARTAVENAVALRRHDTRAAQLRKQIDADEQEYLRLRQDKAAVYQDALNAWKNGEVSRALSRMQQVLELDRRAPDSTAGEAGDTYEVVYNQLRSEHDAMQAGYAEARRLLADGECARALEVCETFHARYPGHALFHALRLDIDEEQRQQLSAFIANVDRRLDVEPDLDTKVSLLREAIARYPDEPHFRRPLKAMEDKRDLVNAIVARARLHEEQGDISQALNDFETLAAIYSPYPGLVAERQRLQRRLEEQAADAARTARVEEIERMLAVGDYERADARIAQLAHECPGAAECTMLRQRAAHLRETSRLAEQLFQDGQRLCSVGDFDEGVASMERALGLDNRPDIRHTLCDVVIARAEQHLNDDLDKAAVLAERACEWHQANTRARAVLAEARARLRERGDRASSTPHGAPSSEEVVSSVAAETVFLPRDRSVAAVPPTPPGTIAPPKPVPAVRRIPAGKALRALRSWARLDERVAVVTAVVLLLCAAAMARQLANSAEASPPEHPPATAAGRDEVLLPDGPPPVLPTVVRILNPDGDGADVKINGVLVGTVQQGSYAGEMPPGEHLLELVDRRPRKTPRTAIALETVAAGLGRARSLVSPEQRIVVVIAQAGLLRVQSNTPNLAVAVDGMSRGSIGPEGLEIASLGAGVHELTLGAGSELRKVSVAVSEAPAIDIMMFSDRNVGSLLLRTGEDNASVVLDGRPYHARTRRGELRIANLTASSHTIAVSKAGFKPSDVRTVRIVKGQETTVTFALTPVERLAKLLLQQATPDAEVMLDDQVIGRVAADGTLSHAGIAPGSHTIVLTKAGHEPWRTSRNFVADQSVVVSDVTLPLVAITAPPPVAPHVSVAPTVSAPVSVGLELLQMPAQWSQRDGWMVAKGGGFVLSRQRMASGRLSFALKRSWKWTPFSNGNRINMVVGYTDSRNHLLLALDEKYYYRSEVVNGARRQLARVEHHLSDKVDAFHIDIELAGGALEFRVSDGVQQATLDRWTPADRSAIDGQVGFFVPGQDEVRLSSFRAEMRP
jgi:tetratricopeptide (TPR) repeat protein